MTRTQKWLAGLAGVLAAGLGALWWWRSGKDEDGMMDDTDSLGELSQQYETAAKGFAAGGVVSTGRGDAGGVSYGAWQFASSPRVGTAAAFVAWLASTAPLTAAEFDGRDPGTAEFSEAWRRVALSQPEAFWRLQHRYVAEHHYFPARERVAALGVDVDARSRAVREVLWSTAVQHGVGGAADVFRRALNGASAGSLSDAALIRAVYGERGRKDESGNLARFPSSSLEVQASVEKRFKQEREAALAMVSNEGRA